MRLLAVLPKAADREIIDADGSYCAVGHVSRRLLRDVDEILVEIFRRPLARGVPCFEQDPLAALKPMRIELFRFDRFGVLDLYHPRPSDGRRKRHLVESFALSNEMDRTIHVGSGVGPHRDLRDVGSVAVLYAQRPFYPDRWVVRPVDHTAAQRDRYVYPAVLHAPTSPFRAPGRDYMLR